MAWDAMEEAHSERARDGERRQRQLLPADPRAGGGSCKKGKKREHPLSQPATLVRPCCSPLLPPPPLFAAPFFVRRATFIRPGKLWALPRMEELWPLTPASGTRPAADNGVSAAGRAGGARSCRGGEMRGPVLGGCFWRPPCTLRPP